MNRKCWFYFDYFDVWTQTGRIDLFLFSKIPPKFRQARSMYEEQVRYGRLFYVKGRIL